MHAYTQKKREVRSFFTLIKGFAIPAKSRKTTEVHARYVQPSRPQYGRGPRNYISTRTFIVAATTFSLNFAKILMSRKQLQ